MSTNRRELIFIGGGSRKFWTIDQNGTSVDVSWGKIGTAGQTQHKQFPTVRAAEDFTRTKLIEKVNKGYVESNGSGTGQPAGPPDVTVEEMADARARLERMEEDLADG